MKQGATARLVRAARWAGLAAACVAYSFLAHFAAADPEPDAFDALVAVAPLLGLAVLLAWRSPRRPLLLAGCLAICLALWASSAWLVRHYNWIFLLQHAGFQVLLGIAFGRTLFAGEQPMVSRFAAVVHGTLSPRLARYTRQVTWAWTIYFASMATASVLLFLFAPVHIWSAFANLLNLPFVLLMFAAEYLVRRRVLPLSDMAGPLQAIRAWRQSVSGASPPAP